jgi:hypothetical protein
VLHTRGQVLPLKVPVQDARLPEFATTGTVVQGVGPQVADDQVPKLQVTLVLVLPKPLKHTTEHVPPFAVLAHEDIAVMSPLVMVGGFRHGFGEQLCELHL